MPQTPDQRRQTRERRAQVAAAFGQHKDEGRAAKALGMRRVDFSQDLFMWRRAHPGQDYPGERDRRRAERMRQAAEFRAAGLAVREIAAEIGCHHSTIVRLLTEWDGSGAVLMVQNTGAGTMTPHQADAPGGADIVPLRRRA